MLELITKTRSRKGWLFLLLVAPLVFTPIYSDDYYDKGKIYEGLTVGPQLAFPIGNYNGVGTINWGRDLSTPFDWRTDATHPRWLFVDWGRIAYWELWVLFAYFYFVPWLYRVVLMINRGLEKLLNVKKQ